MSKIKLLEAGSAIDDRGEVIFANEFNMKKIKRFYIVSNHRTNFIRAWHGHKKENKYVMVLQGAAMVCAVKIDNWKKPSKNNKVERIILSEKKQKIMFIPKGYANGFKTLKSNTKIIFFSTSSTTQSLNDDFRFDYNYWNPWKIYQR
mgnify:FL=1|tara:strand:- start:437 stop:877 length:441 start_codon:yes stop_codon:yes gene_type:complete